MALGIKTDSNGGDFMPICKYDARAGRFMRVDRTQGANGWETDPVDITSTFKAVMDMEHIEVGWMNFSTGGAPDFKMMPLGFDAGQRPSDGHKEGFRITLKLGKECGGDIREFASTAKAVLGAFDQLHDEYLQGRVENGGKLPVVVCTGTRPITTNSPAGKSTNYAPIFAIKSWVARPADLVAKAKTNGNGNGHAEASTVPSQTPAATGSTRAAPPPPSKAAAPAVADAEDFG